MRGKLLWAFGGCLVAGAASYAGQALPDAGAKRLVPVQEPTEIRVTVGEDADQTEVLIRIVRGSSASACRAELKKGGKTLFAPTVTAPHGVEGMCQSKIDGAPIAVRFVDGKAK